jgi:hypothetical protein
LRLQVLGLLRCPEHYFVSSSLCLAMGTCGTFFSFLKRLLEFSNTVSIVLAARALMLLLQGALELVFEACDSLSSLGQFAASHLHIVFTRA